MGRKEEILKAATLVFSEKGYHGTSMEEVADAAGVVKGTLYLYYGSKAELFVELIFKLIEITDRWVECALELKGGIWNKIEYLINTALEYFIENRNVFSILHRGAPLEGVSITEETCNRIDEAMKARVMLLASIFALHRDEGEVSEDFTDQEAAFFCFSIMEGMVRRFIEGWEKDPKRNADIALKFLKNGLSKKN